MRRIFTVLAVVAFSLLAFIPPAHADTIGGYPLRPVLSGTLTTHNAWVAWAGTTLSVTKPGGEIRWLLGTSLWVAANGQVFPYWGDVTATVWVEQSTASCLVGGFYCHPTVWNTVGPIGGCTVTATAHAQSWTLGDRGCWRARDNLSYYKISAVLTWTVPLDMDPGPHGAVLVSEPILVR